MVKVMRYEHIVRDHPDAEPRIEGTRITVARVVVDVGRRPKRRDLEKLVALYPDYLTLEKVQAAMAYYQDNRREIDSYIEESRAMSGQIIRTGPPF